LTTLLRALGAAIGLSILGSASLAPAVASAQLVTNTFVRLAPRVPGVIYRPASASKRSRIAVVVMHDNNDFLDHPATLNLASRGFVVLAANPRYAPDVDDRDIDWDDAIADLGAAVRYAKAMPGIDKVVILGHSSGAPLAAAYQNIAENGVGACQGAEKIVPCPSRLAGLARADAIVLLDPIFGLGANVLTSVDPAQGSDAAAFALLDMYSAQNGFSASGATYSEAFRKRFLSAQAARNAALIEYAISRRGAVDAGQAAFADDEPLVIPGATRTPRLWRPDLHLLSHTHEPHLLLRGDGSVVTEIVHSVRVPSGLSIAVPDRNDREAARPATFAASAASGTQRAKPLLVGGSLNTTVKRFLDTFASRSTPDYDIGEDSISGIDWNSSYTSTPGNLEGVTVPLLVMGMTGHYWIVSAEIAWQHAASEDKSLAYVEGATHGFSACVACAQTPNQFGDTTARTFEFVAAWLSERF